MDRWPGTGTANTSYRHVQVSQGPEEHGVQEMEGRRGVRWDESSASEEEGEV